MNGQNFKSGSSGSLGNFASLGGGNVNLGEKKSLIYLTSLMMHGTCTISNNVCHLSITGSVATYFEMIYDLVGVDNGLSLANCWFHPQLTLN
jgi:hypothetical protein